MYYDQGTRPTIIHSFIKAGWSCMNWSCSSLLAFMIWLIRETMFTFVVKGGVLIPIGYSLRSVPCIMLIQAIKCDLCSFSFVSIDWRVRFEFLRHGILSCRTRIRMFDTYSLSVLWRHIDRSTRCFSARIIGFNVGSQLFLMFQGTIFCVKF